MGYQQEGGREGRGLLRPGIGGYGAIRARAWCVFFASVPQPVSLRAGTMRCPALQGTSRAPSPFLARSVVRRLDDRLVFPVLGQVGTRVRAVFSAFFRHMRRVALHVSYPSSIHDRLSGFYRRQVVAVVPFPLSDPLDRCDGPFHPPCGRGSLWRRVDDTTVGYGYVDPSATVWLDRRGVLGLSCCLFMVDIGRDLHRCLYSFTMRFGRDLPLRMRDWCLQPGHGWLSALESCVAGRCCLWALPLPGARAEVSCERRLDVTCLGGMGCLADGFRARPAFASAGRVREVDVLGSLGSTSAAMWAFGLDQPVVPATWPLVSGGLVFVDCVKWFSVVRGVYGSWMSGEAFQCLCQRGTGARVRIQVPPFIHDEVPGETCLCECGIGICSRHCWARFGLRRGAMLFLNVTSLLALFAVSCELLLGARLSGMSVLDASLLHLNSSWVAVSSNGMPGRRASDHSVCGGSCYSESGSCSRSSDRVQVSRPYLLLFMRMCVHLFVRFSIDPFVLPGGLVLPLGLTVCLL
ncbi:hypothetical protein DFP72DRAFT_922529 [Ephemerocybe angulata]|uniref:Uncharacterized protein n=1 Tax=Ephemerocybe angulata TaxID=980116 RepID=A0A8H6LZD9_9AGAR|nr:hypothetical protein DFP72DRAFT_922529 [Tulosesus angulatus]